MRYITKLTGKELRAIRVRAEMDYEELAAELGISAASVRYMEQGNMKIRRTTAMSVRYFEAHYLGGPES